MFNYYSLKQMLLKAVSLGKNRQGLVLVQRIANGPTGTYLVHKWIRPDQVSSSDHVLAGHIHLHSSHPQAPNNPKQYSNFNFPYSNAVKQQTAAFFSQLPNVQAFYQALHNLGITYTADPTRPGITLMRAKGAMNAAIHNGLDLSALPPQVLGLNNPVILPAQPAAPTQQPIQQPTAAQPVTPPPVTPAAPSQPATVPTTITLPPRAKVASQASKDAATQFCNSFATRQDFYDALTKMGITWTQTSKPGPTFMWAKCFLAQHIESGFDPAAAWAAIQNGTAQQSTQPQPAAQVPPPQPAPAAPPVDKSLLEVPKDATPAQIELIKHINNMTDYKTIRKCAVMGMVPEDDVAADYITDTMLGRLRDWVNGSNRQSKCPASVAKRFIADMADIGEDVKGAAAKLWSNNSERVVDSLGVTGCKKSLISDGLNRVFRPTDMAALITPHQFITPVGSDASRDSVSTLKMLSSLTNSFSDYTTDKQFDDNTGKTNLGYTGYNPDEYRQRYDVNKEGLVRFLQKVKQDNVGNAEVAAEVDRMIHDYDEAMKIVGGNVNLLKMLVQKDSWGKKQQYSAWNFGSNSGPEEYDPENLQFTMKGANAQADALLSGLQSRGYSTDQIVFSINNFYYNDDLRHFKVRDNSGQHIFQHIFVDLYNDLTDPVTGANPLSDYGPSMSNKVLKLALIKLQEQTGLSDADAKAKGWYKGDDLEQIQQWIKDAQHYATYTEADAKKVRDLINGIFEGHTTNPSAAKTTIMANALMAVKFNRSANTVANDARDNVRNAQNANGSDYAGNFDFYSPDLLIGRTTRATNLGNDWNSATYTAQELSDKITSQLNSTPSYSAEYIQQLTQYYMDKAAQQGMAPTIDNAHTVARKDNLSDMDLSAGFDPLLDSPLKDVVYKTTVAMLSHVPKMKQDPKFQSKIDKKLNYLPYDFTASTQPRLKPPPKTKPQNLNVTTDTEMKAARQKLFKAASCSVATESEQVSEQMRKDINQNRFDYKAGEKTPDGKTFSGPFHRTAAQDNRCVLYNSRFFAIHNSIWEERFNKKQAELKAAHPNDPDMWTSMDLFHGTARGCSGNILGRTAGWWMGKSTDYTAAGKMLGPGAYFGFKLGKSTVYAGDVPYSNIAYNGGNNPDPGNADGVVIMANVMRGDNFTKIATTNESYTSVSTDGTRDWEMAVRDNALIFPHHFVDVSCRSYKKNVKVDDNGNYLDDNGNITHDKYGKSVTMK